jgi:hypothetical protein
MFSRITASVSAKDEIISNLLREKKWHWCLLISELLRFSPTNHHFTIIPAIAAPSGLC